MGYISVAWSKGLVTKGDMYFSIDRPAIPQPIVTDVAANWLRVAGDKGRVTDTRA